MSDYRMLTTKRVGFVTARMARMEDFDITELQPSVKACKVVVVAYRHLDPETIEVRLRKAL